RGFIECRQEFFFCGLHLAFVEETNSAAKKKVRHDVRSLSCDGLVEFFCCFGQQIFLKGLLDRFAMLVVCQFGQQLRKSWIILPNNGGVSFSFLRRKRSISRINPKACIFFGLFPSELLIQLYVICFPCCSKQTRSRIPPLG